MASIDYYFCIEKKGSADHLALVQKKLSGSICKAQHSAFSWDLGKVLGFQKHLMWCLSALSTQFNFFLYIISFITLFEQVQ